MIDAKEAKEKALKASKNNISSALFIIEIKPLILAKCIQ